jgi:hypothetical protein
VDSGDVLHLALLGDRWVDDWREDIRILLTLMVTHSDSHQVTVEDEEGGKRLRYDPTMPSEIRGIIAHAESGTHSDVWLPYSSMAQLARNIDSATAFALQKGAAAPFLFKRLTRITPCQLALHSGYKHAMQRPAVLHTDAALLSRLLGKVRDLSLACASAVL